MILESHESCLGCGYALAGLPTEHRCPECGMPFDRETVVFRPKQRWKLGVGVLVYLPLFLPIAAAVVLEPMRSRGGLLGLTVLVAMVAIVVWMLRRRFSRGPAYVALTKHGIRARTIDGVSCEMAYADIGDVCCEGEPCIRAKAIPEVGRAMPPIPTIPLEGLFDNERELREFERRARARWHERA